MVRKKKAPFIPMLWPAVWPERNISVWLAAMETCQQRMEAYSTILVTRHTADPC